MNASRRIFFALWPDSDTRFRLAALQRGLFPGMPGRAVNPVGLHLTLAFIGNVSQATLECCRQAAAMVEEPSFSLRLDTLGIFERAQAAWIGPAEIPQGLENLVSRLNGVLAAECGFVPDAVPFQPHVTLLRGANVLPRIEITEAVEWPVQSYCLLESHSGLSYIVLREYRLGK